MHQVEREKKAGRGIKKNIAKTEEKREEKEVLYLAMDCICLRGKMEDPVSSGEFLEEKPGGRMEGQR